MSSGIHPGPGCPCAECNPLRAYTDAIALLREWQNYKPIELSDRTRAFLSRIRAEAGAPEAKPHCHYDGFCCAWSGCRKEDGRDCPLPRPDPPQPPPRTRAEVDAEIAAAVRSWDWGNCNTGIRHPTLERLCSEPTHHTPAESPAIAAAERVRQLEQQLAEGSVQLRNQAAHLESLGQTARALSADRDRLMAAARLATHELKTEER